MVVGLLLLCALLVVALLWREREHQGYVRLLQEDWALERRELANRIQAPGMIPQTRLGPVEAPVPPSQDEAMLAHLGQIIPAGVMDDFEPPSANGN